MLCPARGGHALQHRPPPRSTGAGAGAGAEPTREGLGSSRALCRPHVLAAAARGTVCASRKGPVPGDAPCTGALAGSRRGTDFKLQHPRSRALSGGCRVCSPGCPWAGHGGDLAVGSLCPRGEGAETPPWPRAQGAGQGGGAAPCQAQQIRQVPSACPWPLVGSSEAHQPGHAGSVSLTSDAAQPVRAQPVLSLPAVSGASSSPGFRAESEICVQALEPVGGVPY